MVCKKNQIINPKTNRCVNKDGKIGKMLLKTKNRSPSPKKNLNSKCKPHQIINPATNRCVNRDGKIGKQILSKQKQYRREERPVQNRRSEYEEKRPEQGLSFTSKIDYISGPISLYEISIGDKHIYLFGERHTLGTCEYKPNSIEITAFMDKVLKQQNITIDFFLETPGNDIKDPEFIDIFRLSNLVRDCIPSKTKKINIENCKIGINRAHWVDVRQKNVDRKIFNLLMNNVQRGSIDSILNHLKSQVKQIHEATLKYLKTVKESVCKEIRKTNNEELKKIMLIWAKELDIQIMDSINTLCNNKNLKSEDFINFWNKFFDAETRYVDIYFLSRMFKSYPKNIIFYAGDDHTTFIVDILSQLSGYKLIKKVHIGINDVKKCFDIRSFKRPFFSNE